MMSESEKNIDIEYSSPTNISQSQKLLGKQNSDNKFQKSFISGSEIGSIEKMEKNDTSNLSLPLEEDNDLKYRLINFFLCMTYLWQS